MNINLNLQVELCTILLIKKSEKDSVVYIIPILMTPNNAEENYMFLPRRQSNSCHNFIIDKVYNLDSS